MTEHYELSCSICKRVIMGAHAGDPIFRPRILERSEHFARLHQIEQGPDHVCVGRWVEDVEEARPAQVTPPKSTGLVPGAPRLYRCNFCGKDQEQVKRLIAGPGGVYICDECIDLCQEIIQEEEQQKQQVPEATPPPITMVTRAQLRSAIGDVVTGFLRELVALSSQLSESTDEDGQPNRVWLDDMKRHVSRHIEEIKREVHG